MRTLACATVRRGVALVTSAVLVFLFLPITAQAFERPTSATATVLTLPSSLTATLASSGTTTGSLASPSTIGSHGYRVSDFQPNLGAATPAFELETSFLGCLVISSTCADLGGLTIAFSQPLTNPTLHIAGLGDNFTLAGTSTNFHAILTITTAGVTLSKAAGSELSVNATTITTVNPNVSSSCTSNGTDGATTPAGCGSVRLNGTGITAVSFDVTGSTFRASGTGTGTLPATASDAFAVSVTADQDYGDAPAAYETNAARHLASDLRLGSGFTSENNNIPNGNTSPNAGPSANGDFDDAIATAFPNGVVGAPRTYTRTVALTGVSQTARLCGWVDFDRDSVFESSEQDCQTVTSGQTSATFAVTGTPASAGASYARFRLGYTAAQVQSPTGPADSGEVEDYPITFISAAPALTLTKSADRTSTDTVGQITTYTFTATNTGDVTINNVTITDPKPGMSPLSCTPAEPATLSPGAVLSCTATRATTQADLNTGGVIANTAIANGTTVAGPLSSPAAIAHVMAQKQPAIAIVQSASPNSFTAPGETITYTLTVTNTGNVPLSNTQVTDPKLTGLSCTPPQGSTLDPGATKTCTGTYVTTQADVDFGGVSNVASVAGTPPSAGPNATDVDALFIPGPPRNPNLSLTKTASPTSYTGPGETITYTFVATNTGNVTLTSAAISDPKPGLSALACTPGQPTTLAPGASLTCTATRTTTQGDVNAGSVGNNATVTGSPPFGPPIFRPGSVTIPGPTRAPAIDLVKTANPVAVDSAGDLVTYTFVATNTGNVTLDRVVVTDPLDGVSALGCDRTAPVRLAPGDLLTCTATYAVTQADLDFGSILNTALVSGEAPGGDPQDPDDDAVDIDDAVVTATPEARIELVKTADPVEVDEVGELVTYTLVAANTGNSTLTDVQISDPLPGLSALTCDAAAPVALAPDDELSCSATYQTTQADMDAGAIDNRAIVAAEASGGDTEDPADDVTAEDAEQVSVEQKPGISLANDADPTTVGAAGQTVTFWLVATNTGNMTLTGVEIDADLPGLSPLVCDQPATLASGETLTCEATYVATQADTEAGHITNVATVTATPAGESDAVTDVDEAVVTIGAAAGIELNKTATGPNTVRAGEVITYELRARNTGTVPLTGVTMTDPLGGLSELDCDRPQPSRLEPEETVLCRADYVLTQVDVDRGEIANMASVTGRPVGEAGPVGDDDSMVIDLVPDPSIGLVKTVDDDSVRVGDVVTYTLVATNTGNSTLSGVVVKDPLAGLSTLHCDPTAPAVLAPGASLTCTATYRATTDDAQRGEVVNTATVTGMVNGDSPVSADAGVKVEVQPAATIHLPPFLGLADTGGPTLVWLALAGLLTLAGATMFVAAHGLRE